MAAAASARDAANVDSGRAANTPAVCFVDPRFAEAKAANHGALPPQSPATAQSHGRPRAAASLQAPRADHDACTESGATGAVVAVTARFADLQVRQCVPIEFTTGFVSFDITSRSI